jgi:N-acetylneuraminate synthase
MFKNLDSSVMPYLIAEIGINHNGDIEIAKKLIDATSATNWNCAKFQKRNPDVCVPEHQKEVLRETPWGTMKYIDYKYKVEFEKNQYDIIDIECKNRGIDWSASVWDYDSLDFLLINYPNTPFIKIPSAINGSYDFLVDTCKTGYPILVSLGMTELEECDKVLDILNKYSSDFCIMHTNSAYPTPNNQLNLSLIPFFKQRYNCPVGYSGHEADLEPSVIAAIFGACVIERHVTLDHTMWGSDHSSSLEVHAMNLLRKRIVSAKEAIGIPEKKVFEAEAPKIKSLKNIIKKS